MPGETPKKERDYGQEAVKLSPYYGGKLEIVPKIPIRSLEDFAVWYTPGVASVSKAIHKETKLSFEYTSRWNTIAIITDGTRVLGLGDIGPEAAMPVMEGKAVIFKYLGGVDALPICINRKEPEKLVELVKSLEPSFGGINLEDIASPKCFYILEKLRQEMNIPVWHDDQLGTASATLAGLLNALKITNKKINKTKITLLGAGASNIATARILEKAGADPGKITLVDSKGILHPEREDIDELMLHNRWKYELALKTNREKKTGGPEEAIKETDVLIAASKPGPGVVKKEWIKKMNSDAIVFALANPTPEIWPWEAKEAGARIVATGRSDLPNQVNNSLVFPSVFRGALDVRATAITDEMIIRAAKALAECIPEEKLNEDYIIPTMNEWEVYAHVAASVADEATKQRKARINLSYDEAYARAVRIIARARKILNILMNEKIIRTYPATP